MADDPLKPISIEDHKENGFIPISGNLILSYEEWKELKDNVEKFYSLFSPKDIKIYNLDHLNKTPNAKPASPTHPLPSVTIPKGVNNWGRYVYWISSPLRKGIKIGKTGSGLYQRLKQIARELNLPINCIGVFESFYYHGVELDAHKLFHRRRLDGEWFDLNDNQIDALPQVCRLFDQERRQVNA